MKPSKKVPGLIVRRESESSMIANSVQNRTASGAALPLAKPKVCACGDIACVTCSKTLGKGSVTPAVEASKVNTSSPTSASAAVVQPPISSAPPPSSLERASSTTQLVPPTPAPASDTSAVHILNGTDPQSLSTPAPVSPPRRPIPSPTSSSDLLVPLPSVSTTPLEDFGGVCSDPLEPMQNPLATHDASPPPGAMPDTDPKAARLAKFRRLFNEANLDLDALRQLSWNGVPPEVRPMCWQLLLGYLPTNVERRRSTLERKRKEYRDCIPRYLDVAESDRTDYEMNIYRQILVDVPRTNPDVPLFQTEVVQRSLERILYIWAMRHPASGYVQGINDLVTPFFVVFLSEYVEGDVPACDIDKVPTHILDMVEADSYWCVSNMLDSIQDHYTFAQPGIQRMVFKLKELMHRIDGPLYDHLEQQGLQFLQFAFRWINCLLMRELSLPLIIRVWDTYLAEGDGFAVLHAYVCAAFLATWSQTLQKMEFQELVLFLQHLPTHSWTDENVGMLLSQAFVW
eukprot:CAMPEP_0184661458 /NCGR_PEP_ID=MMETSP0308-20130426/38430_1 /TAXON_ID=38269 /ORGANISM="Gloeochaete witrockiana, Strain SAG 46.84" /LENGTH=513 /DNA_ID=CAMNT_0027102775 /DNA_START=233 /DNA_END=1771 /DNA_ORIENTATION=-